MQLRCPKCGASFDVGVDDGFETKAAALELETETSSLDTIFTVKSVDVKQRIIEGWASTADLDQGDDIVEANACKFNDPTDIGVFIGHDWRLGALPAGYPIEIRQDGDRVYTKTKIHNTTRGNDLLIVASERAAIGKPLGLSIGFPTDTVVAKYDRKDGRVIRRISSLQLKEYSFTSIPMNPAAVVTAVKSKRTALKAVGEMSAEERRAEIQEAINCRAAGPLVAPASYTYVVATFSDYVIVCDEDSDYWQIPYTINAAGEAELGEPFEVEQAWTPKDAASLDAVALELKAGRVLSDANVQHLQEIHDRAHTMGTNAGHDLHAGADNSKSDPAIFGAQLDLELAVATTKQGGLN
jgi:phage head maturation protease